MAADVAAFIDRGRPWCLGARSSEKVDAACMDREESKYIRYTYIYIISRHVIEDFLEASLVDDLRRKRFLTRARNLAGLLLPYRRP